MKRFQNLFLLLFFMLNIQFVDISAQCPMCRMSAETNLKNGGTQGKGLNKGILYLFAAPYLLIGGLGYVWYKNRAGESRDEI